MSKDKGSPLPASGSEWVSQRTQALQQKLQALVALATQLEERGLWRERDERCFLNLKEAVGRYLVAIALEPESSYAAHNDLCLYGPCSTLTVPVSPSSRVAKQFMFLVDGYAELLERLWTVRLTHWRMVRNPPAKSFEDMEVREKAARAHQPPDKFIFEDCENRPEYKQYLETMESELETTISDCGLAQRPSFNRHEVERIAIKVSGATRWHPTRYHPGMSLKQLLRTCQVADRVPTFPVLLRYDWEKGEEAAKAVNATNRSRVDTYLQDSQAAWRPLTPKEIDTVINRIVE